MRLKPFLSSILGLMLVLEIAPALSQTTPAATSSGLPLEIGGGFSNYSLDWGAGRRMDGVTVWADWSFYHLPGILRGLGVEAEGRDIRWGLPADLSNAALHDQGVNMRQDTVQGGLNYTWRRHRKFHPYVKYLEGIGSINFPPLLHTTPAYRHDTFTVLIPGGGVEYQLHKSFWVRGDYEYEFWEHAFGTSYLNPNGITVGVAYNFIYRERR
jgi:hypothetical protein